MTEFAYDHVHLRSPDPEETARYYERMFGAEVIKSTQSDGRARVDMKLGGVMMFIAKVESIQVEQSVLGRLLNYGTVVISGTGIHSAPFASIADPLTLRKHFMTAADAMQSASGALKSSA